MPDSIPTQALATATEAPDDGKQSQQTSKLFRQEALLAARHERLWGELVVPVTPARWLLIIAATLTIAFLFALAKFGHYTRAEKISGYLKPSAGEVRLQADQNGIVKQMLVKIGDVVEAGQPLILMSAMKDPNHDPQMLAELEASIDHINTSLEVLGRDSEREVAYLKIDIKSFEQRLEALAAEATTQREQKALAKIRLKRGIELHKAGVMAAQDKENIAQDVLQLDQAILAAGRNAVVLRQQLAGAKFRLSGLDDQYQTEELKLRRDLSRQKRERLNYLRKTDRTLLAQRSGDVTVLNVFVDSTVRLGQTLLVITPTIGRMEAVLFLPPKGSGFVDLGQKVQLRVNAFPHEQFGTLDGKISEYARAVLMPDELPAYVKQSGPVYRIKVALISQKLGGFRLRSGMDVEATIALEKRAIWEWMLAPLLRWHKRVTL